MIGFANLSRIFINKSPSFHPFCKLHFRKSTPRTLVSFINEQGYKIELTEEQIRNQIKTYRESYQASLNLRVWFFSQLVNGGFDLNSNSRTNFLWDELILHFVGRKCNGDEILLVTSDKKMNEAAKKANQNVLIKTYDEYLNYIGMSNK